MLVEVAILKKEKLDKDDEVISKEELVFGPKCLVAKTEQSAAFTAIRSLETVDDLDDLEVLVRPFK